MPYSFMTFLASLALLGASSASACPTIGHLIDFNCDQKHKIAFTGDSVVFGVKDYDRVGGGGYVARVAHKIPTSTVENLGVPGIESLELYAAFKQTLNAKTPGKTFFKVKDTDLIIIDVGRNDYWRHQSPFLTVRNIRRLVKFLRAKLTEIDGTPPLILVATLIPTTRAYQRPFIDEVNALLLSHRSADLPVYVRYDKLPSTIISKDGIHPTSLGYSQISNSTVEAIRGVAQTLSARKRRDKDKDGVYDNFETLKFGSDPTNPDSDGDGLTDGIELFTDKTNPTVADTDGDGTSDGEEIIESRDPLVPDAP